MPNYENETCEGCVSHEDGTTCGNTDRWTKIDGVQARPEAAADSPICDLFKPDLECRNVRAVERLARSASSRDWSGCRFGDDDRINRECPAFKGLPDGCHDCEYWGGY